MKKIEEIIEELRQWEKEGKGRAVAVAATDGSDVWGNISGRGFEVASAVACIMKNAEDNGLPLRVMMSLYEEMKDKIQEGKCVIKEQGNERYS